MTEGPVSALFKSYGDRLKHDGVKDTPKNREFIAHLIEDCPVLAHIDLYDFASIVSAVFKSGGDSVFLNLEENGYTYIIRRTNRFPIFGWDMGTSVVGTGRLMKPDFTIADLELL